MQGKSFPNSGKFQLFSGYGIIEMDYNNHKVIYIYSYS